MCINLPPKGGDPNPKRTNCTRGGYPTLLTPRPTSWGSHYSIHREYNISCMYIRRPSSPVVAWRRLAFVVCRQSSVVRRPLSSVVVVVVSRPSSVVKYHSSIRGGCIVQPELQLKVAVGSFHLFYFEKVGYSWKEHNLRNRRYLKLVRQCGPQHIYIYAYKYKV